MINYKDGICYITWPEPASWNKMTFHASHKLFKDIGLKKTISRFKEWSLWVRSALLVKYDETRVINVLASMVSGVFEGEVKEYVQKINQLNAVFIQKTWANSEVVFDQRWTPSETWSAVTVADLEQVLTQGSLHVDRYDDSLRWVVSQEILLASKKLNNKAFVDKLMERFRQIGVPCPKQVVLWEKIEYQQLIDRFREWDNYIVKLAIGAFGSQVVELWDKFEVEELLKKHNQAKEEEVESSILVCDKVKAIKPPWSYHSPCVIWRVVGGEVVIEQVSEQSFSEDGEYIWSERERKKEEKFLLWFWKEKLIAMAKIMYEETWYEGYFWLDFILWDDGNYHFIGDINARMNGSDDLFLVRRLAQESHQVEDAMMCDISVQKEDQLKEFSYNGQSGVVFLPEIGKEIGTKFTCVWVFINPGWNKILYEKFLQLS